MRLLFVAVALGMTGCLPSEYEIEVRAGLTEDAPIEGLLITALPIDRDALRDSLAAGSETRQPQFPELDSALSVYELPDISGLEESFGPFRAIRDSVRHLSDSMNLQGTDDSSEYAEAYARLRDLYQRLARSSVERDASIREVVGDDRQLAMRAAAAADSMRAWEGTALASFPELADSAILLDGRGIHTAITDENGVAHVVLPKGQWWLVATSANPDNPFSEYYWNVDVRVRFLAKRSVQLTRENSLARWRY